MPTVISKAKKRRFCKTVRGHWFCAEGEQGFICEGIAEIGVRDFSLRDIPHTETGIMLNPGNPTVSLVAYAKS